MEIKKEDVLEYTIAGANFAQDLYKALVAGGKPYYRAVYQGNRYFVLKDRYENSPPLQANDYEEITNKEVYKANNYVVCFTSKEYLENTQPIAVESNTTLLSGQEQVVDTNTQDTGELQPTANVDIVRDISVEASLIRQVEELNKENAYNKTLINELSKQLAGVEQDRDLAIADNVDYEERYNNIMAEQQELKTKLDQLNNLENMLNEISQRGYDVTITKKVG